MAIVSPMALPIPRITPESMPFLAAGSITRKTAWFFVHPRANAPS